MRPIRVTGLVMVWLLTNATWAFSQADGDSPSREPKSRAIAKRLSEENAPNQKWQAEAWAETEKDATSYALDRLARETADYLFEHGLTDWRPDANDIKSILKPEIVRDQKNFEDLGTLEHITVVAELKPDAIRKFQKEARQQRASGRMVMLGKGLGMLVALLAGLAGYFRIEEATKGYYTTWLRLTTVGFIGAAATTLWIIR
jgi:hypothetical protein